MVASSALTPGTRRARRRHFARSWGGSVCELGICELACLWCEGCTSCSVTLCGVMRAVVASLRSGPDPGAPFPAASPAAAGRLAL